MPRVGFETTIPVFERTKAFRGSDRATTVIYLKLLLVDQVAQFHSLSTHPLVIRQHSACFD
jgi:hypothetical protein